MEGNRKVTRKIEYYNLDMIIAMGYRVKSNNGIIFRRWVNKILKEYMLKDYAVNYRRLEYLEKRIKLIDIANRMDESFENKEKSTRDEFVLWRLFVINVKIELLTTKICIVLIKNDIGGI